MQNEPYTSIFGVGLLDDLHNYFPDVLYNHQRFTSVQDLLRYIQDQTRSRFNLLDYGRRLHASTEQGAPAAPVGVREAAYYGYGSTTAPQYGASGTAPVGVREAAYYGYGSTPAPQYGASGASGASGTYNYSAPIRASVPETGGTPDVSGNLVSTPIRVHTRTIAPRAPRRHTFFHEYPTIYADDLQGVNLMTSLLNNLIQTPVAFTNSFTDVVVHPTNQQIDAATTVETLPAALETACPICQEDMLQGNQVRRITRCNHPFHADCIGQWFEQSCVCPICRTDIRGGGHQP